LTSVTQIARRGERRLRVPDAESIHAGDVLDLLDIDHHRDAPFENLFQNLSGNLHMQDGGSKCYGPPSGARNTCWGVDGLTPPIWLGSGSVVLGDVGPNVKEARSPAAWIEAVPGLEPRDLRAAQGLRRQAQTKPNHR
jgi:hypothetical protein